MKIKQNNDDDNNKNNNNNYYVLSLLLLHYCGTGETLMRSLTPTVTNALSDPYMFLATIK